MTRPIRNGGWMQTYTGKRFFPLDPDPAEIDIVDIAHHLAMVCRYNGATKFHYSVAQHSVLMAERATPKNALRALLHDAPEAYLGDMIRPLKKQPEMSAYADAERVLEHAICVRFGIVFPLVTNEVKTLDNRILSDEREQVMALSAASGDEWGNPYAPLGVTIEKWAPEYARAKFMLAFEQYSAWGARVS